MRNKDTHSRITDKCRCLFVVAYSAMSITGLSSVLAVENHALSSPVSDRVESVQQKKHVSGNVQDANGMPLIGGLLDFWTSSSLLDFKQAFSINKH